MAQEQAPACKAKPDIVAACFTVHGRLSFWNGAPSARIWPVGTHRLLGIHNDELPQALRDRIAFPDTEMWGDFQVCPFTRERPGHMQFVCVESWQNLEVRERKR
jgi:hypothetical protein